MRILFDSRKLTFKDPFGTLTPHQSCTLHIHIPSSVQATHVQCQFCHENGEDAFIDNDIPEAVINWLKTELKRIDDKCMEKEYFWFTEYENLYE